MLGFEPHVLAPSCATEHDEVILTCCKVRWMVVQMMFRIDDTLSSEQKSGANAGPSLSVSLSPSQIKSKELKTSDSPSPSLSFLSVSLSPCDEIKGIQDQDFSCSFSDSVSLSLNSRPRSILMLIL